MYFYKCKECENIVFSENEKEISCCGQTMELILPNQVLEGEEQEDIHYLKVRKLGALVTLSNYAPHPMLDIHFLEFALIQTDNSFYYRKLDKDSSSVIDFLVLNDEKVLKAYAYCNQFGLMETEEIDEIAKQN